MSAEHSMDVPPNTQVEQFTLGALVATDKPAGDSISAVTERQVYALMAYYMALLLVCIAIIVFVVLRNGALIETPGGAPASENATQRLFAAMAFLGTGAVVGSVLYQIRMLFKFYITSPTDFDSRWLAKYISAPIEAVGLAFAIVSVVESGAVVLGGQGFNFSQGKPFASFGFGALVGFGIREVVGWLGAVTKTVFPTGQEKDHKAHKP